MAHNLLVAERILWGSVDYEESYPDWRTEPFEAVAPNGYGRGSNSMSPFRIARMAACVRS
jgi:hypothetical protein